MRGRRFKTTAIPDTAAMRPPDLVPRRFTATRANQGWFAALTLIAAWRGFVYVVIVIDVVSRRFAGGRGANSLTGHLALDALEQALHDRPTGESVIGLFKTVEIRRRGPLKRLEDVEFATRERSAWFNASLLLNRLGALRRTSTSWRIMIVARHRLKRRYSRRELFGEPGAVHR